MANWENNYDNYMENWDGPSADQLRVEEMARDLMTKGFAIIRIDAHDVPNELLGEVVELQDFFWESMVSDEEPMFEISGFDGIVAMSDLQPVM